MPLVIFFTKYFISDLFEELKNKTIKPWKELIEIRTVEYSKKIFKKI